MRIVFMVAAAGLAASCGGPYTQAQARDMATDRSCDWYAKCGEIGAGKKYGDRDQCEVDVRSGWNDMWPVADCDKRIAPEDLDLCLKAIDITQCGNSFDFFNTVFNKCSKAEVCKL